MGLEHPGAGARRGPYLPAIFAGEAQIEVEVIWTENVRTAAVVTVRQLDSTCSESEELGLQFLQIAPASAMPCTPAAKPTGWPLTTGIARQGPPPRNHCFP
jgi:hypothetical protein